MNTHSASWINAARASARSGDVAGALRCLDNRDVGGRLGDAMPHSSPARKRMTADVALYLANYVDWLGTGCQQDVPRPDLPPAVCGVPAMPPSMIEEVQTLAQRIHDLTPPLRQRAVPAALADAVRAMPTMDKLPSVSDRANGLRVGDPCEWRSAERSGSRWLPGKVLNVGSDTESWIVEAADPFIGDVGDLYTEDVRPVGTDPS